MKDPVALDCISKLAADNTKASTSQQLKQDSAVSLVIDEPAPSLKIDDLPCSTNEDLSTITPLTAVMTTNSSDYDVKVLSQAVGQQSSVASEIPLFFAPHDLLSLPVITLPLMACSIASSGDMPTLNEASSSDKSFVTVAAVGELSSVPENMVIKQAYRPL